MLGDDEVAVFVERHPDVVGKPARGGPSARRMARPDNEAGGAARRRRPGRRASAERRAALDEGGSAGVEPNGDGRAALLARRHVTLVPLTRE